MMFARAAAVLRGAAAKAGGDLKQTLIERLRPSYAAVRSDRVFTGAWESTAEHRVNNRWWSTVRTNGASAVAMSLWRRSMLTTAANCTQEDGIAEVQRAPAAVAARIDKMRKAQWAAGADAADRALAAVAGGHPSRTLVQRLIVDENAWNAVTTDSTVPGDSNWERLVKVEATWERLEAWLHDAGAGQLDGQLRTWGLTDHASSELVTCVQETVNAARVRMSTPEVIMYLPRHHRAMLPAAVCDIQQRVTAAMSNEVAHRSKGMLRAVHELERELTTAFWPVAECLSSLPSTHPLHLPVIARWPERDEFIGSCLQLAAHTYLNVALTGQHRLLSAPRGAGKTFLMRAVALVCSVMTGGRLCGYYVDMQRRQALASTPIDFVHLGNAVRFKMQSQGVAGLIVPLTVIDEAQEVYSCSDPVTWSSLAASGSQGSRLIFLTGRMPRLLTLAVGSDDELAEIGEPPRRQSQRTKLNDTKFCYQPFPVPYNPVEMRSVLHAINTSAQSGERSHAGELFSEYCDNDALYGVTGGLPRLLEAASAGGDISVLREILRCESTIPYARLVLNRLREAERAAGNVRVINPHDPPEKQVFGLRSPWLLTGVDESDLVDVLRRAPDPPKLPIAALNRLVDAGVLRALCTLYTGPRYTLGIPALFAPPSSHTLFVSYQSSNNVNHQQRVQRVVSELRRFGIDAVVDVQQQKTLFAEGPLRAMIKYALDSDVVIAVADAGWVNEACKPLLDAATGAPIDIVSCAESDLLPRLLRATAASGATVEAHLIARRIAAHRGGPPNVWVMLTDAVTIDALPCGLRAAMVGAFDTNPLSTVYRYLTQQPCSLPL